MPHFWIMLPKYGDTAEYIANKMIENPNIIHLSSFGMWSYKYHIDCDIDGNMIQLWIANYPFAYAVAPTKERPSRITIYRLKKVIDSRIKEFEYNVNIRKKVGFVGIT